MDSFLSTCEWILQHQSTPDFTLSSHFLKRISKNDDHYYILQLLIESRKDIHQNYQYLLRRICMIGNVDLVKLLVKYGANLQIEGGSCIIEASMQGHIELLKYLIEQGVNIHEYDEIPLRYAITSGHLHIVKILLDSGANLHILDDRPLINAILSGRISLVKLLLHYGANPSAQNHRGLWYALQKGIPEIILCLLNYGCPTNVAISPDIRLYSPESVYSYTSMLIYLPVNPRKRWLL
jgi:ankyrin repeat protein